MPGRWRAAPARRQRKVHAQGAVNKTEGYQAEHPKQDGGPHAGAKDDAQVNGEQEKME